MPLDSLLRAREPDLLLMIEFCSYNHCVSRKFMFAYSPLNIGIFKISEKLCRLISFFG